MSKYKFSTNEFGVSETGIHLLRSNFNYETIDYKDIISLEIDKGKLISNWILVLLIGVGLIGFSIYYVMGLVDVFYDPTIKRIYIEEIIVPVLTALLGGYAIYSSTKTGIVIKINNKGKITTFPLTEIVKQKELNDFISYLKSNRSVNFNLKIIIDE